MTMQEARELLLQHSFAYHDLEHPKMIGGFLGSLRPYQGLKEKNFHEVMEALHILAPQLQGEKVDREMISALWSICYATWLWGLEPDGMLQRNGLIAPEDVRRLSQWLECLGMAVMFLLEGIDTEKAFNLYTVSYPVQAERLKNPIQGSLAFDGDPSRPTGSEVRLSCLRMAVF